MIKSPQLSINNKKMVEEINKDREPLVDQRKTQEIYSELLAQSNLKFEEKVKELSILRGLGDSLLYANDIKSICKAILDVIVDEFDTEFGSLMLLIPEENVLKLFAATSKIEDAITFFENPTHEVIIPLGEGIAGRVAAEKIPILISDTEKDDRFVSRMTGHLIHSMLCVPLVARGKTLGVVNLSSPVKETFTEKDVRIMTIVSEQSALAIQNEMLIEEKLKNERMSAIGSMASAIIHDISNPMTKVGCFAELIADPKTSQADREEFSRIIISEVERFTAMTSELMKFARGTDSKPDFQEITIESFFRGIIPLLKRDFTGSKIELVTSIEYNATVFIDVQQFQRAVFNLTGNARDAIPSDGNVMIRTAKEGKHVVLSISDTGKGIPKEIMGKIFLPFMSYNKPNGTGLGLSIVKKIVEDHNGSIEVQSKEGKGAEFFIKIPIKGN